MWEFWGSILGRLMDWLMALHIRPSIKVTQFNIDVINDKKKSISFSAFISNNSNKTFSVSQKNLMFFNGKRELAKVDVTRYEIIKRKDVFDEFNVLSPVDDIIILQPGETKEIKIFGYEIEVAAITKVVFSCYTGRKTYNFPVKIPQRNIVNNKETGELLNEQEKHVIINKIKEGIELLNKNIGAVTWISTVAIAVVATWSKFMWYVYQRGKLFYWDIDPTAISIVDDITLYNIFLFFIFGGVIIGIMLIPLVIIKSKMKIIRKIVTIIAVFLAFSGFMYISTGMKSLVEQNGVGGIISAGIVLFIAFLCFFSPSWAIAFTRPRQKDSSTSDHKSSIIELMCIVGVCLIVMTTYSGWIGYNSEKEKKEFRITGEGYAILYETNDYYYLAEYDKEDKRVKKEHQIIVKKENIDYFIIENIFQNE